MGVEEPMDNAGLGPTEGPSRSPHGLNNGKNDLNQLGKDKVTNFRTGCSEVNDFTDFKAHFLSRLCQDVLTFFSVFPY